MTLLLRWLRRLLLVVAGLLAPTVVAFAATILRDRAFGTDTAEIANEITIYPDVGHAFLNEHNFDQSGTAGDAWQQTLEFLESNL